MLRLLAVIPYDRFSLATGLSPPSVRWRAMPWRRPSAEGLRQRPTHTEEGQLHFKNGGITYCPSNNTIAIFYAKADDPSMGTLTIRIIPIGKVTSDLGAFDEMESWLEFSFDNVQ